MIASDRPTAMRMSPYIKISNTTAQAMLKGLRGITVQLK